MEFAWIQYAIYFIAIALAVVIVVIAKAIKQLLSVRIQHPKYQLKKGDEMPPYLKQVYGEAIRELKPLGFKVHHYQVSQDMGSNSGSQRWSLILINPDDCVYAELSPACTLLDMPGYEIDFWSIGGDGNALLTRNGRGHMVFAEMPGVLVHDPMTVTVSGQYRAHLMERKQWSSSKFFQTLDPAAYVKMQQKLMNDYFVNLRQNQGMISTGNNQFRLSLQNAILHVFRILKAEHRLKNLAAAKHRNYLKQLKQNKGSNAQNAASKIPVEAEMQAYQRLNSNAVRLFNPVASGFLIAFFAFALSLAYFTLDLVFSFHSIFLILLVVLFHEMGHALAMMYYRIWDQQVFILPSPRISKFARNTNVSLSKQVIVYLMGPLPGIVLGISLILFGKSIQELWLYEIAILLLIYNYLNLLPFKPLDGGYMVRLAVREKYFTVKVLLTISGAAAFGATAYFLHQPVFYVLAAIMVMSLPFGMRDSSVLKVLYKKAKEFQKEKGFRQDFHSLDWNRKLAWAFYAMKQHKYRKIDFFTKFKMINSVKHIMQQPRRGGAMSSMGLLVMYMGILALVPTTLIVTGIKMEISAEVIAKVNTKFSGKILPKKLITELSPEQQFESLLLLAQEAIDQKTFHKAGKHLHEAKNLYPKIKNQERLAKLHRVYSVYYLKSNKLRESEESLLKAIAIYDKKESQNYKELAASYTTMSEIRVAQSDLKAVEITLQKAVGLALKIKDPEDWHILLEMAGNLLDWYYSQNLTKNAQQFLLALQNRVDGTNKPLQQYVAKFVHQELGWLYADRGNATVAMEQFDQALSLVDSESRKTETGEDPVKEETNLLLAKAAIYYDRGYHSFSRMSFNDAETRIKQHDYQSLKQYIDEYRPQTISVNRGALKKRDNIRWRLIESAYNKVN